MLGALDCNNLPNISGCLAPLTSKYFKFNCAAINRALLEHCNLPVYLALLTRRFGHESLEQLRALFVLELFNGPGSVALFTT